jgi:hypothetical protein
MTDPATDAAKRAAATAKIGNSDFVVRNGRSSAIIL